MPSRRPSSALARCCSALRRWLRYTRLFHLPLSDWLRGWRDRHGDVSAGRGRPHVPEGTPRPRVSLDLLLLENRFSPDDMLGLGLSVRGMPLSTPGMVLLAGWSGDAPGAHIPIAVA